MLRTDAEVPGSALAGMPRAIGKRQTMRTVVLPLVIWGVLFGGRVRVGFWSCSGRVLVGSVSGQSLVILWSFFGILRLLPYPRVMRFHVRCLTGRAPTGPVKGQGWASLTD